MYRLSKSHSRVSLAAVAAAVNAVGGAASPDVCGAGYHRLSLWNYLLKHRIPSLKSVCVTGRRWGATVGLRLKYVSPHLEEGFPGELVTEVVYSITDTNALRIDYHATSDRPTLVGR